MNYWLNRSLTDDDYMGMALDAARLAAPKGEVPVGALTVTQEGRILGIHHNLRETQHDATAHAEILAIQHAGKELRSWRLEGVTLYVTMEPCPMCAGALVSARVKRLVYGCRDPKAGSVDTLFDLCRDHRLNHRLEVSAGIRSDECSQLLRSFFEELRISKRKGGMVLPKNFRES